MRLAYRGANFHGWQTQPIESSNTKNEWMLNSMRSSDLHFFDIDNQWMQQCDCLTPINWIIMIYLCEFAISAKDANYPSLLNLQPPARLQLILGAVDAVIDEKYDKLTNK